MIQPSDSNFDDYRRINKPSTPDFIKPETVPLPFKDGEYEREMKEIRSKIAAGNNATQTKVDMVYLKAPQIEIDPGAQTAANTKYKRSLQAQNALFCMLFVSVLVFCAILIVI